MAFVAKGAQLKTGDAYYDDEHGARHLSAGARQLYKLTRIDDGAAVSDYADLFGRIKVAEEDLVAAVNTYHLTLSVVSDEDHYDRLTKGDLKLGVKAAAPVSGHLDVGGGVSSLREGKTIILMLTLTMIYQTLDSDVELTDKGRRMLESFFHADKEFSSADYQEDLASLLSPFGVYIVTGESRGHYTQIAFSYTFASKKDADDARASLGLKVDQVAVAVDASAGFTTAHNEWMKKSTVQFAALAQGSDGLAFNSKIGELLADPALSTGENMLRIIARVMTGYAHDHLTVLARGKPVGVVLRPEIKDVVGVPDVLVANKHFVRFVQKYAAGISVVEAKARMLEGVPAGRFLPAAPVRPLVWEPLHGAAASGGGSSVPMLTASTALPVASAMAAAAASGGAGVDASARIAGAS